MFVSIVFDFKFNFVSIVFDFKFNCLSYTGLKLQLLQKMGVESLNVMLQLVCFFIT